MSASVEPSRAGGPEPRNHLLDVARLASVLVVVVFHCLLYQIDLVEGRPVVTAWAPSREWWIASWFFMIMPLFFIAGGFAHALSVDRMRRSGTSWGTFLASRGRRLVGPLVLFVTVLAAISTAAAWFWEFEPSRTLSAQLTQLLWFITVYLAIVLVAPLMVRAHDRFGLVPMLALAALAGAVDAWSFAVDAHQLRNLNMLFVWPLCHQFGIAYHRGWFRRGPLWQPVVAVVLGVGSVLALVNLAGYPIPAVGFADIPIANVQPPTLAMAALGLAQSGGLGLLERARVLRTVRPRTEQLLGVANALLVTVYLWHIPFIFLGAGALLALSFALPALKAVLLSQAMVAAVTVVLIVTLVGGIGLVEFRLIPPLGEHQSTPEALVAFAVLLASTAMVWQGGTVLHPGSPLSTAGVLGIWLGSHLMARSANRPVSASG